MSRASRRRWQGLLALICLGTVWGCSARSPDPEPQSASAATGSRLTRLPGDEKDAQLSSDGRIAFTADVEGASRVYLLAADGEPVPLTSTPGTDSRPTWSPDGRHIAFQSDRGGERGLWIVSTEGGEARPLTPPGLSAYHPDWSPDGSRVAFISDREGSFDLWTIDVDGGELRRITDHPGGEWWPRWSPDSDQLVFYTSWGDAMTDIWTVDVTNGRLTQLTENASEDYRPDWSPTGDRIVFVSNRLGSSDLWIVPAAGGDLRRVTDDTSHRDFPSWSADGEALIFSYLPNTSLYSVAAAGGVPKRLTSDADSEFQPVVSPDGRWIAYLARHRREVNVWVMPAAGGPARVLAAADEFQQDPVWSPNGARVAFIQGRGGDGKSGNLWIADAAGGPARQRTWKAYVSDPVWCAGGQVIFAARLSESAAETQLWRVDASGDGEPVQLTRLPGHHRPTDCSADGRTVAFSRTEQGAYSGSFADTGELFVMPVEGGAARSVETGLAGAAGARWAPDGRRIAFISRSGGVQALYTLPVDGGAAATLVIESPGLQSWPSWSADGDNLYVAISNGGYDLWRLEARGEP